MKLCENCGSPHNGQYGSGRFCCSKCARGFSTKYKRKEINEKVSIKLTNFKYFRDSKDSKINICNFCKNEFTVSYGNRNRKYCSLSCLNKFRASLPRKKYVIKNIHGNNFGKHWTLSEEVKRNISLSNKGGRCKWYSFTKKTGEIIKVQGTYELRFVKILNEIDENWIKPTIHNRKHQFNWIDKNGKSHWYTPDFWSPKLQQYFEVKGFWPKSMDDKKKFVSSLKNVKIIYKSELEQLENTKSIDY